MEFDDLDSLDDPESLRLQVTKAKQSVKTQVISDANQAEYLVELYTTKFVSNVALFSFGDVNDFKDGLKSKIPPPHRSIAEECLTNDGGIWKEDYTYVVQHASVEEPQLDKSGAPVLYASGTVMIKDKGRAGMYLADYCKLEQVIKAKLTKVEVAMIRMYTGEFYRPWNNALRFGTAIESWATCIAVLYSAVLKLSFASGQTTVFRGVNESELKLPPEFLASSFGNSSFAGGVEMAFMSTTTDFAVAVEYSGGASVPGTLFKIDFDMASRGANVQCLSQFADEAELLFPPCTMLTCTGVSQMGHKRFVNVRATISTSRHETENIQNFDQKPGTITWHGTKEFVTHIAFVSAEASGDAVIIQQGIEQMVEAKASVGEHLLDVQKIREKIDRTDTLVVLLTQSVLAQAQCLVELYFALESDIPIVAVTLVGRGYEEAETLNLFTDFRAEIKRRSAEAVATLVSAGIDVSTMARKLGQLLPLLPKVSFDPNRLLEFGAMISSLVRELQRAEAPSKLLRSVVSKSARTVVDHNTLWAQVKVLPSIQLTPTPSRSWKTVRLYIASTPHDFDAERQQLLKQVVPQLRVWCESRKIQLVEIDLQWSADAEGGASCTDGLALRMRELRRCREENVCPYFLCLLSETYGWVPSRGNLKAELIGEYSCVEGFSQTAMEIVYGGYTDTSPNAYFAMRDPSFLEGVPEAQKPAFADEGHADELKMLKDRIERRFPSKQILRYAVMVEAVASSGQVAVKGLDGEFTASIINFFKSRISAQYPVADGSVDVVSIERKPHQQFVDLRGETVYGRDEIRSRVVSYVTSAENTVRLVTRSGCGAAASTAFSLHSVQCLLASFLAEQELPLLMLQGEAGAGKSALVAACAQQTKQLMPHLKIFYHFVGAAPGSTDLVRLLRRLFMELAPGQPIPASEDELVRTAPALLQRTGIDGGVALFLDAVNQLDEDALKSNFAWLPPSLPPGVRCVVSAITHTDGHQMVFNRLPPPVCVSVPILRRDVSEQIVRGILSRYHRSIDGDHVKRLLAKEGAKNPLWLVTACEELRVHPSVATVGDKIASFADSLLGILQQVLSRFESEHGKLLVTGALCFLECSRHGLLETELLALLADEKQYTFVAQDQALRVVPNVGTAGSMAGGVAVSELKDQLHEQAQAAVQGELIGGQKAKQSGDAEAEEVVAEDLRLSAAHWSPIYHSLRPFLRPCGEPGEGRIDFYHRAVSKAVRLKYLTKSFHEEKKQEQDQKAAVEAMLADRETRGMQGEGVMLHTFLEHQGGAEKDEERYTFWHAKLANYFERCRDQQRKAEELPYHLEKVLDNSRLMQAILDWDMFEKLAETADSYELLHYSRVVGGYAVIGVALEEEMDRWAGEIEANELQRRQGIIGKFLGKSGNYKKAIATLKAAIGVHTFSLDAILALRTLQSAELLHILADTINIKCVAANHLGAQVYCRSAQYAKKAVAIRRTADLTTATNKANLAESLRVLGSSLDMYFFCCERCNNEGYGRANGPLDNISVQDAKKWCQEALEESVKLHTELNHPMLAVSLQELGMMYYYLNEQGLTSALRHLHSALRAAERALGTVHLETARICFNIGLVQETQIASGWSSPSSCRQMRSFFERCYRIRLQLLGEDHPSTQRSFRNWTDTAAASGSGESGSDSD
jgi:hypothetical protein